MRPCQNECAPEHRFPLHCRLPLAEIQTLADRDRGMSDAPATSPEFPLNAEQQQQVLDTLSQALENYVCADTARQLQAALHQWRPGENADAAAAATEATDAVADAPQWAEQLTLQLQQLSGDRQLRVHFSPQPLPDLDPDAEPTAEDLTQQHDLSSQRNFDLNRVERLRGNVGYLELYGFEPPEFVGDALAAAMTLLQHTQALIIDLRHNRGGSPDTVALLCSYLLPAYPPIHLHDVYWRPDDSTRQWWTVPHLPAPRYLDKPVYLITSQETFSAAEAFADILQQRQRATVIGEHTAGGANPGRGHRLSQHFWVFVPTGRAINPMTGDNWAETGIIPDVKVPAELTLLTAHLMALNRQLENPAAKTPLRELQMSMLAVERELNAKRADLISQLKQPAPNTSDMLGED